MAKAKQEVTEFEPASRVRRASSVVRALDVLADPWSFLILREAFFGIRRFDQMQANLAIARNILSDRLTRLVDEGVLARRLYEERPPRYEYVLTEAGRDFYPAIVMLMIWGDRWRCEDTGRPLELFHSDCGRPLVPVVVCSCCRQPLSPFDVEPVPGPGAGEESGFEPSTTRRRGGEEAWLRGRPCSVARALSVIGDRWSFRILRESFLGVRRFEEFQRGLGIARNILSDRLNQLVEQGILVRRAYQTRPERAEYVLGPAGLDLYPSVLLLMRWGDKWRDRGDGPPLILRHKTCGSEITPILECSHCGGEITARRVTYSTRYTLPRQRQANG